MSLTDVQKRALIAEMSIAQYEAGTVHNLLSLKLHTYYGKKHEEDIQTKELWVTNIREEAT